MRIDRPIRPIRWLAPLLIVSTACRTWAPEGRQAADRLEREVRSAFQKPLRVVVATGRGFHGRTTVAPDGTPVVHIDPAANRTITRTHELFHLLGIVRGVPRLEFRIPRTWDRRRSSELVWLESQLRGAIQHAAFYGEMRGMGLDPDATLRREVRQVLAGSRPLTPDPGVASPERRLVVLALRVHLECRDPALVTRFHGWLASRVEPRSVVLVQRAIALLDGGLGDELDRFVACLNLLFEDDGTWSVVERGVEKRGTFEQRTATVGFRSALPIPDSTSSTSSDAPDVGNVP